MPRGQRLRRRVGRLIDLPIALRRRALAGRYLSGTGIEIGALHKPLPLPAGARVRYVDRMSVGDLRAHYPELADEELCEPDIIDDGERLATIADGSLDFVVANHFIEHTQDPISTLENHARVLKPGGILYLGVPDKRRTFDRDREITSVAHIARDRREGPGVSRTEHYEDWARHVERSPDVQARARLLMDDDYSIHFHVWTPDAFRALLEHARSEESLPLRIEEMVPNRDEFIAILRKQGGHVDGDSASV
jgi:SAM-dependent methyltransferase